ncbi:MAG: carbohydrate kinase family protein [Calditrichaeota bacterium]|jgi:sulfofructose kinase|nr:carbohydrate kinase family protein [Calditrichota bacterium]MBT7618889.1 carbohydrate kinase family protein [Calditrichota bacterium]MBT7787483.1 carbohydrate kinase family protein [Calditrichota bacterium]
MTDIPDVFGLGHCCIDYLNVLDPFPDKGKKGEIVDSLIISGGPVPTALQALKIFGRTTRFCGKVGDDEAGEQVISELDMNGIDTTPIVIDPEIKTAIAHIWIDISDGSRTIALNRAKTNWISESELDNNHPKKCRLFLTDGRAEKATIQALQVARNAGIPTVFDSGAVRPGIEKMLPLVDYAVVSIDFADTFLTIPKQHTRSSEKEAIIERGQVLCRALINSGAGTAIVTVGEMGAVWSTRSEKGLIPGFEVDVYDTTGAGDIFHAGFIHGLLEEWCMTECIRFGNAAAALSCRKLSGLMGIPTLEEINELLYHSTNTQM